MDTRIIIDILLVLVSGFVAYWVGYKNGYDDFEEDEFCGCDICLAEDEAAQQERIDIAAAFEEGYKQGQFDERAQAEIEKEEAIMAALKSKPAKKVAKKAAKPFKKTTK